jgi:hypothetical protein
VVEPRGVCNACWRRPTMRQRKMLNSVPKISAKTAM